MTTPQEYQKQCQDREDHRRQCEARVVLKWPKEKRQAHYEAIRGIRGNKATEELITEVKRQYRISQEKAAEIEL